MIFPSQNLPATSWDPRDHKIEFEFYCTCLVPEKKKKCDFTHQSSVYLENVIPRECTNETVGGKNIVI